MKSAAEFFRRRSDPVVSTCFVLMPFEEGMNAVYEHGIKPLVESLGIQCRRADEIYSAQGILGDIWESIQTAEFVIADLTNRNPNVMYELGLCHALWKRVILLSQNKDHVPFDLRAWRVIWYDFTFAGAARLKDELHRAIEAIRAREFEESTLTPITVRLKVPKPVGVRPATSETSAKWLHGTIESWNEEKGFGFILSGGESFYFSTGYLFASDMTPRVGLSVTFMPLDPLPTAKNRRASKVFVHGSQLKGTVSRIIEGKGYGFAEIIGQAGEKHSLLVLLADEGAVGPGKEVYLVVSGNPQGPTGVVQVAREPIGELESEAA